MEAFGRIPVDKMWDSPLKGAAGPTVQPSTARLRVSRRSRPGRAGDSGGCRAGHGRGAASRTAPGVDVWVSALPDLPFADESFDAVVGNFVFNHVGQPRAAVTELRRVTSRGGRVAR
ncbi:methyltransferase domain-containing protein [Actinosynnema sp. NPDC023587]|uniref:class I SAM-dependent methyltransferase n=1 Tax=Actinosynnema sp. NPDC023587 TaxID=3154695 RepID=UPI0033F02600